MFWTGYQLGFRFARSSVGTQEFFAEVTPQRDALEPHFPDVVDFGRWKSSQVLEAGSGIGTVGAGFAEAGARYTGFDFSASALSLARRRFDIDKLDGRFASGSITSLPFRDPCLTSSFRIA